MFPAATKGGGMCFAFPDVLNTPAPPLPNPVPIPYPNIGQLPAATMTTLKVKIMNMPAVHKNSQVPVTSGGEAGVQKGVISPMQLAEVVFRMGSVKVKVEGQPLVTLLKPTGQNGTNANAPVGMVVAPSQAKVIVLG